MNCQSRRLTNNFPLLMYVIFSCLFSYRMVNFKLSMSVWILKMITQNVACKSIIDNTRFILERCV